METVENNLQAYKEKKKILWFPLIFLSYSENSAFFKFIFITKVQVRFFCLFVCFFMKAIYADSCSSCLADQKGTEQMTDLLPPHSQALDSFS